MERTRLATTCVSVGIICGALITGGVIYFFSPDLPANREAQMLKELTEDAEVNWGVERISTDKCVIVDISRDRRYHKWFAITCGDHPTPTRISAKELAKDIQEVVSPYDSDYRREYLPILGKGFAPVLTTIPAPPDFVGW